MVMGERARGENRRRRKNTHHPMSRRLLETQNSPRSTRMEAPTSSKQKSSKRSGETGHPNATRLWRGETLTSIQKGQLRATLAGSVHTCARMWARGTVVTELCPACGHENEDLTPLWWNCKAEQYAHIREKAPQPTNVEAMHPPYRDMIWAQKDTQLPDWGRNEIAAVAAAE